MTASSASIAASHWRLSPIYLSWICQTTNIISLFATLILKCNRHSFILSVGRESSLLRAPCATVRAAVPGHVPGPPGNPPLGRTGPADGTPMNPKRPREFWVGSWGLYLRALLQLYSGAGGAGGARTRKRRISRVRGNRGAGHLRATKRWAVANSASLGFSCPGFSCPQGTHNVPERRQEPGGLPRRRNQARSHRISRFDLGAR